MICAKEAVPRARSAMPGVRASIAIAASAGRSSERSSIDHAGIASERAGKRHRGGQGTGLRRGTDHGDTLAALAGLAQRLRDVVDGHLVQRRGACSATGAGAGGAAGSTGAAAFALPQRRLRAGAAAGSADAIGAAGTAGAGSAAGTGAFAR